MTQIRKEFYKRLIYIGLGIIPIILLFDNKGAERFIALAGFLFSMFNFIRIIIKMQLIVDDFFPPKTYDQKSANRFDKIIYYIAMVLFFGGLFSELFVIRKIDNTLYGLNMFLISAVIGLSFALIIILYIKIKRPSVFEESNRRLSVIMGLFIGLFLLFPAIACLINESNSETPIMKETYTIVKKGSSSTKNKEHYLYIGINGDEQRVTVSKSFWLKVEESESLILLTKKGILGYKYIIEFETNKNE